MGGSGVGKRKRFSDHGLDLSGAIHAENLGDLASHESAAQLHLREIHSDDGNTLAMSFSG